MKSIIAFALLVAVAAAATIDTSKEAFVKSYEFDNIGVNGFKYFYETSDGKSASEEGILKNVGTENEAIEVRGQFSYVGADNVVYTVTYIANENGFQPQGAHIPKV